MAMTLISPVRALRMCTLRLWSRLSTGSIQGCGTSPLAQHTESIAYRNSQRSRSISWTTGSGYFLARVVRLLETEHPATSPTQFQVLPNNKGSDRSCGNYTEEITTFEAAQTRDRGFVFSVNTDALPARSYTQNLRLPDQSFENRQT
jgi:hypothetical protein